MTFEQGVAQKAKELRIKGPVKKNVFKNKAKKTRGLFTPAMLLDGSKQVGGRFVWIPKGWGAEFEGGYSLNGNFTAEVGVGIHVEKRNEVEVNRIPVHLGIKYKLIDANRIFFLYGGVAFNSYFQSYNNIEITNQPVKTIVGPSVFGEAVFSLKQKLGLVLRAEEVFILKEKIWKEPGKQEAFYLRNLSIGLRKTL